MRRAIFFGITMLALLALLPAAPADDGEDQLAADKTSHDPALDVILGSRKSKAEPPKSENPARPMLPIKSAALQAKEVAALWTPRATLTAAIAPSPPAYAISTVAGNGQRSFGGDGGPAAAAALNRPCAVAVDQKGRLFIADYGNHRVRKVEADGTISTLAGTGVAGYLGDGGPATQAQLNGPYGVSVDRQGNVFVSDQRNGRVRKITPDGIITTVAGNGKREFSGDGGPATEAALTGPNATVSDEQGNLYIADSGNHRVRKVDAQGIITTVAGTTKGYSGDGGPAVKAQLFVPAALARDRQGNLIVGDFRNHVVRKVATDGTITTLAGTGQAGKGDDGRKATASPLNEPGGVGVLPDGSVVIADGLNFRVRRLAPDGTLQTIAGTGQRGYAGDSGPATEAKLSVLDILDVDGQGNLYVADHGNNRIRKLTPQGARP